MESKQIIYNEAMKTPKKNVTTTIRIGVDQWAELNNVNINNLIEYGFRHLLNLRSDNQRLAELEDQVKGMKEVIREYQKLKRELKANKIKEEAEKDGITNTS